MKLLSVILAIIVLFLTVQPICGAASLTLQSDACCGMECEDTDKKGVKDKHEQDCKVCNPFQACGCCSGSVTASQLNFLQVPEYPVYASLGWPCMDFQRLDVLPEDFWQPPRST